MGVLTHDAGESQADSGGFQIYLENCPLCILTYHLILLPSSQCSQGKKKRFCDSAFKTAVGERTRDMALFSCPGVSHGFQSCLYIVFDIRTSFSCQCQCLQDSSQKVGAPPTTQHYSIVNYRPLKQLAFQWQHLERMIPLSNSRSRLPLQSLQVRRGALFTEWIWWEVTVRKRMAMHSKSSPGIKGVLLPAPRAQAGLVTFPSCSPDCRSNLKWINCPLYLCITSQIIVLGWPNIFKCLFFCQKKYISFQSSTIIPIISFNCCLSRRYTPQGLSCQYQRMFYQGIILS